MTCDDFLPPRAGETDEERRLREALGRQAAAMMITLDTALNLRSEVRSQGKERVAGEIVRARHMARAHLLDFCLKAMHAHTLKASR